MVVSSSAKIRRGREAWIEFLDQVDVAKQELLIKDGTETWYRGQVNAGWSLLPSLLRVANGSGWTASDLEIELYYEFSAKARELHESRFDSWDILFTMRHHGVATRLLDWTEQFGIAVYFALHESSGDDEASPGLWILNPITLNDREGSWHAPFIVSPHDLFGWRGEYEQYADILSEREEWPFEKPVAIYPRQVSPRQHAQSGWFTIHGTDTKPLDEMASDAITMLPINPDAVAGGREFLRHAGLNQYSLFPDLDGLARSLHEKYQLSRIPNPLASLARTRDALKARATTGGVPKTRKKRSASDSRIRYRSSSK